MTGLNGGDPTGDHNAKNAKPPHRPSRIFPVMWRHSRQLEADVQRWQEAGWVTPDGAKAIAEELRAQTPAFRLPAVLAILGAVLLGFAAMSFVAANWQEMPKIARLGLLGAALWGFYGLAGWLFSRNLEAFAHAAILGGVGIFGAAIMLIAQMYHIEGRPPDAVLLWCAGAVLAGILLRSNPSLVLAMLLAGLWSGWETSITEHVHWPFLIAWGLISLGFVWHKWHPGMHVSALAISIFVVLLGYLLNEGHAHGLVLIIGLAVATVGILITTLHAIPALIEPARTSFGYAIAVSYAALFALQFIEDPMTNTLIATAVGTLALLIGAIILALRTDNRGALWVAYTAFSIEVMGLYFKSVGTLLGSSVFFLTAGIVVIALAYVAYRLHLSAQVQGRA
ncbi:DUF2157 domain-containing protein [Filomicrobium sp.]|uniref:DUF2157 domain-containing protein n=1 Tax=Filomicrobium sp. TaxID=2024831 RepID=UPI00258BDFF8|nr:DUF2157 domain-containing protein [Filomicrobium sp.]